MLTGTLQDLLDASEDEIQLLYDQALQHGEDDVIILLDGGTKSLRWVQRKRFITQMPPNLRDGKLSLLGEPVGPPGGFWLIVTAPGELGVIRVLRAIMGRGGVA